MQEISPMGKLGTEEAVYLLFFKNEHNYNLNSGYANKNITVHAERQK